MSTEPDMKPEPGDLAIVLWCHTYPEYVGCEVHCVRWPCEQDNLPDEYRGADCILVRIPGHGVYLAVREQLLKISPGNDAEFDASDDYELERSAE